MNEISQLLTDQVKAARVFSETFSTDAGRKALALLRARFYLRSTTAVEDRPIDPYQLAFREGMRAVVLYIADLVEYDISAVTIAIAQAEKADGDKPDPVAV